MKLAKQRSIPFEGRISSNDVKRNKHRHRTPIFDVTLYLHAIVMTTILLLTTAMPGAAQMQSSDYFPTSAPYSWTYADAVIDTLQQPIDSLTGLRAVAYTASMAFEGKDSRQLVSVRTMNHIPLPADTLYVSTVGSTSSLFLQTLPPGAGEAIVDSVTLVGLVQALRGWYDVYQFSAFAGQSYTIFSKDTTLMINAAAVQLRFWITGVRLPDQSATVPAGTFAAAKRFVITFKVSLTALPFFPVDLIALPDTTWIAAGRWIIRESSPSQKIDLSMIGGGTVWIRGIRSELLSYGNSSDVETGSVRELQRPDLRLAAWPNPFNPDVTISAELKRSGPTTISVVDLLGRETERLLDEDATPGTHTVHWGGSGHASGIYFIRLTQGSRSVVSAIQLLK